jgi:hypothetical protein
MNGTFTVFAGHRCLATGPLEEAVLAAKAHFDRSLDDPKAEPALVFEDRTGHQIDFDLRGTPRETVARLAEHPHFAASAAARKPAGPGRPKLGVVSREVSLLPRHWDWLEEQRGGISVTLRALVEEASKRGQHKQLARKARDAAGKFMWTVAGNLPDFEEASRALYAMDLARLKGLLRGWPKDVKKHVERLVAEAARLDALATLEA